MSEIGRNSDTQNIPIKQNLPADPSHNKPTDRPSLWASIWRRSPRGAQSVSEKHVVKQKTAADFPEINSAALKTLGISQASKIQQPTVIDPEDIFDGEKLDKDCLAGLQDYFRNNKVSPEKLMQLAQLALFFEKPQSLALVLKELPESDSDSKLLELAKYGLLNNKDKFVADNLLKRLNEEQVGTLIESAVDSKGFFAKHILPTKESEGKDLNDVMMTIAKQSISNGNNTLFEEILSYENLFTDPQQAKLELAKHAYSVNKFLILKDLYVKITEEDCLKVLSDITNECSSENLMRLAEFSVDSEKPQSLKFVLEKLSEKFSSDDGSSHATSTSDFESKLLKLANYGFQQKKDMFVVKNLYEKLTQPQKDEFIKNIFKRDTLETVCLEALRASTNECSSEELMQLAQLAVFFEKPQSLEFVLSKLPESDSDSKLLELANYGLTNNADMFVVKNLFKKLTQPQKEQFIEDIFQRDTLDTGCLEALRGITNECSSEKLTRLAQLAVCFEKPQSLEFVLSKLPEKLISDASSQDASTSDYESNLLELAKYGLRNKRDKFVTDNLLKRLKEEQVGTLIESAADTNGFFAKHILPNMKSGVHDLNDVMMTIAKQSISEGNNKLFEEILSYVNLFTDPQKAKLELAENAISNGGEAVIKSLSSIIDKQDLNDVMMTIAKQSILEGNNKLFEKILSYENLFTDPQKAKLELAKHAYSTKKIDIFKGLYVKINNKECLEDLLTFMYSITLRVPFRKSLLTSAIQKHLRIIKQTQKKLESLDPKEYQQGLIDYQKLGATFHEIDPTSEEQTLTREKLENQLASDLMRSVGLDEVNLRKVTINEKTYVAPPSDKKEGRKLANEVSNKIESFIVQTSTTSLSKQEIDSGVVKILNNLMQGATVPLINVINKEFHTSGLGTYPNMSQINRYEFNLSFSTITNSMELEIKFIGEITNVNIQSKREDYQGQGMQSKINSYGLPMSVDQDSKPLDDCKPLAIFEASCRFDPRENATYPVKMELLQVLSPDSVMID